MFFDMLILILIFDDVCYFGERPSKVDKYFIDNYLGHLSPQRRASLNNTISFAYEFRFFNENPYIYYIKLPIIQFRVFPYWTV